MAGHETPAWDLWVDFHRVDSAGLTHAHVDVEGLRDAVEALTTGHGIEHDGQHRALVRAIQAWAGTTGVELHLPDRQRPPLHRSGLELGL